jgi:hypothetical protein
VIGHGLLLDTPRASEATGTIRMGVAAPHSGATVPSYGLPYFALTELVKQKSEVENFIYSNMSQ